MTSLSELDALKDGLDAVRPARMMACPEKFEC